MDNYDAAIAISVIIIILLFGFGIGTISGKKAERSRIHKEALKRDYMERVITDNDKVEYHWIEPKGEKE